MFWLLELYFWVNKADYRTWILHGLIAILIAWGFGTKAAIAFYTLRELGQLAQELINGKPPKYLYHVMDIVGPLIALGAKWVFHF